MKDAAGIQQGESNPGLAACHNDVSGRCNRGSRTLDTAVLSCLLYPLSYIAGG
jgi:hypothetical protein